jgi:hypothetical protein
MKPVAWMASYQWRPREGGRWQTARFVTLWQRTAEQWLAEMIREYGSNDHHSVEHRAFAGPVPLCAMTTPSVPPPAKENT